MEYGLDWGEPLLENDLEDILDAKINLCYKDYILTDDDYFQGCQTMLTSEKAALAQVRNIYKSLREKNSRNFVDTDFGPKNDKDMKGHKMSLYKDGKIPQKGYTEPADIEWDNIKDIVQKGNIA